MNDGHGRPRVGGMTKRCVRHFSVYMKSMSVRTWMLDTLRGDGTWRFNFTEPFEIKEGQVVQADDVVFQNVWPSISDNDRNVYVVYEYGNQASSRHVEFLSLYIVPMRSPRNSRRQQQFRGDGPGCGRDGDP